MLNYLKRKVDQIYFNKKAPKAFQSLYDFSARSKAYLKYCKQVHGLDFPVQNNVSKAQLEIFQNKIAAIPHSQILDLGCGQGNFSQYIADKFNSRVVGVDFVPISNDNIERIESNYEKLKLDNDRFDIIMAIDSFYMIYDMEKLLRKLIKSLKQSGKIVLFYACPSEITQTKLYRAAQKLKLDIELEKFEDDKDFWNQTKQVLEELEEEFFSEGAGALWKMKENEALQNLQLYENHNPSRYLITLSGINNE